MKKHLIAIILLMGSLLIQSCIKDDVPDNITLKSASFKIDNKTYNAPNPTLVFLNIYGTVRNTMSFEADDGSMIEISFWGNSPATYSIESPTIARYIDKDGKQYESTSGELIVNDYTINDAIYKTTGTFHFKAKTTSTPIDSIEITNGVFINATNVL